MSSQPSFSDEKDIKQPPPYSDAELGTRVDIHDAEEVFGATENGPDYRAVGWMQAAVLLLKSQIGLGVLSLPSALQTLGAVPGVIIIVFLGIVTTYGDYVLGQFRVKHRQVHSVADVGEILWGRPGREILGVMYWLFQTFIAGSGMLATSIAFNTVSEHGTCTVGFVGVAAIIVGICASARTFKQISFLGWIGLASILPAVLIVTIAVGISDRPPEAPEGPFDKDLHAFGSPTFAEAFLAIVNILFAYAGTPSFFSIISEMKKPEDYNKSMFLMQGFSMAFYSVIAIVVWYYCGQYVASPALGSAGPLLKKVAYGIALPGLLVGAILYSHLAAKYIFVRALRGTRHLQEPTAVHWVSWLGIVLGCIIFSFIIAEVIPFFDSLLGLIGALFGSVFCVGLLGAMWLFDNSHKLRQGATTLSYKVLYVVNCLMILLGALLLVAGTYASVVSIDSQFKKGEVGSPFSCADNS